jgi:undecaprenyl-diphosphatase
MDWVVTFCVQYLFLGLLLLYLIALAQAGKKHQKALLLSLLISAVIAAIFTVVARQLYYDPRPFVSRHLQPLVQHVVNNGFPSIAEVYTMTLALVIFYFRRGLGSLTILLALITGLSFMAAHLNFLIDVIAGGAISAISAWLGCGWAVKLLKRY